MIIYFIYLFFYLEYFLYEIKDDVVVIIFDILDLKVRLKILFVVTGCVVFRFMVKIIVDFCLDYYVFILG